MGSRNEGSSVRTTEGLDPRETRVKPAVALMTSFFPGCRGQNADCNFCYLSGVPSCTPIHKPEHTGIRNFKYTTALEFKDGCVSAAESEEYMRNYDFNDDFASVIDQNIFSPGVCEAYRKGEKHEWILKVDNEFLKDGLKHLNRRQVAIIEALLFEGKCLEDICIKYCLSHEDALQEISTMKITLVKYM